MIGDKVLRQAKVVVVIDNNMDWKENFKNGEELVVSTSSLDGEPHSIIAISVGFYDGKLLIADCQMKKTIENVLENPKISVISGYTRLKGTAEIHSEGRYYEICRKENEGTDFETNSAILINIKEVFDMDAGKLIL